MAPKHLLLLALIAAAALAAWFGTGALLDRNTNDQAQHGMHDEPLFAAPAFAYPDQHEQTVTTPSLRGKPWVANFVYTTCRTFCPLLTAKMVQLQRKLDGADLRFVSFSVDPEHDTPAALAEYARRWRAEETRWTLLATGPETLQATARGFHIPVVVIDGGTPGDTVLHTNAFMLIDAEGMVRGIYNSEDAEEFARLATDARALAHAEPSKPSVKALDGEALYHELSCAGCHERPELAPPLKGLAAKRRDIGNGLLVTADADYVRESILAPDAKRVSGYAVRMPTYAGLVSPQQLDTLVAWVLARPDDGSSAAQDNVALETDPVCGMGVRAGPEAIRVSYDGGTYWFCSPGCRERFEAHPQAFAK